MTAPGVSEPTLVDLVGAVCEFAESSQEAAAVVNHLLQTGRVRLASRPERLMRAAPRVPLCRNAQPSIRDRGPLRPRRWGDPA